MTGGPAGRVRAADVLSAFLICEGFAVALWLVPASVHIVRWPASGPERLAQLAPLWRLELAITAGAAVAIAALSRGVAVRTFTPVLALWLWVIPYLPWLPDRLPLLLVLAGPLRWLILAAALGAPLARTRWIRAARWRVAMPTRGWVFTVSFALYSTFGLWAVNSHGLVGDEPHYLIISESLLRDRDLQIENNHLSRDYAPFYFGELRPDYMQRGKNGEIYSIHAPGLPALSLPVYALFGYRGVIVFIALLAALTAMAIFDVAKALTSGSIATLTWIATCVSVPFIPYAWSIFPEMPGAWIVAYSTIWLWEGERRSSRAWLVRGAALGLLPWMHTRFVIFSLVFGAAFALRLRRRPRALLAFAVPAGISAIAWWYSFYAIYGIWSPEAPYGAYATEFVQLRYVFHGLVGILFDQKFGLLFYSPIYLAAPIGAWWLLRDRQSRWPAAVLIAAVAGYVGSTTRLYMFWGGSSAPARFLVPIVPCLAPMIAVAASRLRHPLWRGVLGLWLAIGVGVALFSMVAPGQFVLYSEPHGRARILEIFQAGAPLALSVPTFTDPDWTSSLLPLAWWLAVAAIAIVISAYAARRLAWSPWRLTALASSLFVVGGAVITSRPALAVRQATAQRGALEFMTRFDGPRGRIANYRTLSKVSLADVRALATVTELPEVPAPDDGRVAGPLTFPPGRYDAQVWFHSTADRSGEVSVGASGQATFAVQSGRLPNPVTVPFEIPVIVGRLIVRASGAGVAAAVSRVDIVPEAIVPASERDPSPVYAVESLPSRDGALIAYADEWSYPEHGTFWTRGTAAAHVLIAPAGATRMTLVFSTGPQDSRVTWRLNGHAEEIAVVSANQEVSVSVALPVGTRLVPLEFQSATEFRPGQVDRSSTDMRRLGCRVRIVLE